MTPWQAMAPQFAASGYNEKRIPDACCKMLEESGPLSAIAVIPARYGSMRFPGKPLALLAGKPMIWWVYERVCQVAGFDAVIVATDHPEIYQAVQVFGGQVEMTSPDHASGTDRVWEVARNRPEAAYVFNVQGDEPLIEPGFLEEAVRFLKLHHETADMVTLRAKIHALRELEDPNVVKVVTTDQGLALYFSRAPIPYVRDAADAPLRLANAWRHVGIYGFRREALERFVRLPVSPLEQIEKLEQLRAMEAGLRIYALAVPEAPVGVDTPADLAAMEALLARQQVI